MNTVLMSRWLEEILAIGAVATIIVVGICLTLGLGLLISYAAAPYVAPPAKPGDCHNDLGGPRR